MLGYDYEMINYGECERQLTAPLLSELSIAIIALDSERLVQLDFIPRCGSTTAPPELAAEQLPENLELRIVLNALALMKATL